jgi:hypothetical protein
MPRVAEVMTRVAAVMPPVAAGHANHDFTATSVDVGDRAKPGHDTVAEVMPRVAEVMPRVVAVMPRVAAVMTRVAVMLRVCRALLLGRDIRSDHLGRVDYPIELGLGDETELERGGT